jgi:hypothetical protein
MEIKGPLPCSQQFATGPYPLLNETNPYIYSFSHLFKTAGIDQMVWEWAGWPGFRGKRFFTTPQHPDWLWGPPSLQSSGYQGQELGLGQWQGHEADHTLPFTTEVKNGRNTPLLPISLHGILPLLYLIYTKQLSNIILPHTPRYLK